MTVVHSRCVCAGVCVESAYLTATAQQAEKAAGERVVLELSSDGKIYHHIMRVIPAN